MLPSPRPLQVFNLEAICCRMGCDALVIAARVCGILVVHCPDGHGLVGVKVVIDKHLSAGLLAQGLGVDCVVITTDVATDTAKVFFDWGKPGLTTVSGALPKPAGVPAVGRHGCCPGCLVAGKRCWLAR